MPDGPDGETIGAVSPKQELLTRAAREYTALHEALQGLNEAQMSEVWLGGWSVREIVAHLSGWHREMAPALERLARGEKPLPGGASYQDVDAWNARFAAAARGVPAADLLLELDKSHQEFLQAADRVPEERFQPDRTAWKLVDLNSAHHYHEHAEQIRAWRRQRGY